MSEAHRVVEELLELLVGEIDAELLEAVDVKDLEAGNVEDADEGGALALGAVERAVDAGDDPLEEPLVHRLRYRLHGKLHLFLQTEKIRLAKHLLVSSGTAFTFDREQSYV